MGSKLGKDVEDVLRPPVDLGEGEEDDLFKSPSAPAAAPPGPSAPPSAQPRTPLQTKRVDSRQAALEYLGAEPLNSAPALLGVTILILLQFCAWSG